MALFRQIWATALVVFFAAWPIASSADTYLLMGEADGCHWCEKWDEQISHIYPKTDEGKAAPLRRFNVRGPKPTGVTLKRPVTFTPTFVLVQNGKEVSRLEGYPGEDFFWGILSKMLEDAPTAPQAG